MEKRTVREFAYAGDFWTVADQWAAAHKFRLLQNLGDLRIYKKGKGFWTAPSLVEVRQGGGNVHLEAYVRCNLFTRIMALFMLPKEMEIKSGGFRGVVPRAVAREAFNRLLTHVNQAPVP